MSDQYIRRASLTLGANEGGVGLDLSELRFKFVTRQQDIQSPNTCDIRVYNVSDEVAQLVKEEFSRVVLQAGYQDGNFGTIFDGNIKQFRRGRENETDTYLDILAADGDQAYNFAVVNKTLAAGSSSSDHADAAIDSMKQYNVDRGYVSGVQGVPSLPRAKVLYGLARDVLRDAAASMGVTWSIQNGQVQLIPLAGYLPDEAVVLTAKTGMIGLPEQTLDGIHVKCLLNPRIRIGSRIQLDNRSIQWYRINMQYTAINFVPKFDDDGFYRVLVSEHAGDTRGMQWYTNIIAIALDDTVPMPLAARGIA